MNKKGQIGDGLRMAIMITIISIFFILLIAFFLKKINLGVPS